MAKAQASSRIATVKRTCVLCSVRLTATTATDLFEHPPAGQCSVRITDANGISLDHDYEFGEDGQIYSLSEGEPPPPAPVPLPPDQLILSFSEDGVVSNLNLDVEHVTMPLDQGIERMFEEAKADKLGGASGDLGWSSFSTFQKCPYLWKRMYLGDRVKARGEASMPLLVGTLVHLYLALYYQRQIDPTYPLDPGLARETLRGYSCDPGPLDEAWRVFAAYQAYYRKDYLLPLAVEYHIVDPATKESARYDMIAKIVEPQAGIVPGTWVIEHKSSSRFDEVTLDGWRNDGEVLGQMMLWQRLKLHKRFGQLEGVIVNLLGKQKTPSFHRTVVGPEKWRTKGHAEDLKTWQALRQLCVVTDTFPRSRANCIGRYGKCSQWSHCADRED